MQSKREEIQRFYWLEWPENLKLVDWRKLLGENLTREEKRDGSRANLYPGTRKVFANPDAKSEGVSWVYMSFYSHHLVLYLGCNARQLCPTGNFTFQNLFNLRPVCNLIYWEFELHFVSRVYLVDKFGCWLQKDATLFNSTRTTISICLKEWCYVVSTDKRT